jgi:hypothetical protein
MNHDDYITRKSSCVLLHKVDSNVSNAAPNVPFSLATVPKSTGRKARPHSAHSPGPSCEACPREQQSGT